MRSFIAFVVLFTSACQGPSEPSVRRAAWLGYSPQILAPDTVRVGTPFPVTVVAAIGATEFCTTPDRATVSTDSRVARVELFVLENRQQRCTSDVIQYHPLPISLTFQTLGPSTIRAIGETGVEGALVRDSVERTVIVIQ